MSTISTFSLKPILLALILTLTLAASAQTKPRARDLGVPFDGTPGPNNAITDVNGVEVGHTTLISGSGKLVVGKGPVRTGVTAIHPRGKTSNDAVFAAWFTLNGNGEMTGTTWVDDSGFLNGPVMITNTHSVGVVRDAVIAWKVKHGTPDMEGYWWSLPVVAETWDGWLNDINGFHVHPEDAWHALDTAHSGPVEEGNVGGGTGMICNEFKGGIGTSPACSTPKPEATPSASSSNATTDAAISSASPAFPWAKKFPSIPPTKPCGDSRPRLSSGPKGRLSRHQAPRLLAKTSARSSSSSPPTRRSSPRNSNASPKKFRSASAATAATPATAPETSSSPSPPPTPAP